MERGVLPWVCVLTHSYFPRDPRVSKEVAALLEAGYRVDVVCLRGEGESFFENWRGGRVYRMPVRRHRGAGLGVYLLEYMAFGFLGMLFLLIFQFYRGYRVVHVHNPPDFLVFSAFFSKVVGAKVFLDVHDRMPTLYRSRFGEGHWVLGWIERVERWSVRFADVVITVHPGYARQMRRVGGRRKKVFVVMNTAEVRPLQEEVERAYPPVIFHHGTLVRRYGVHVLVEAVRRLGEFEFEVHIYGEGDFRTELEELVRGYGLEGRVRFFGFCPMERLVLEIGRASVCVVPNLRDSFTETILPTKLFEYIALCKPVIVARTAEVAKYFSESEVTFFTPGDSEELAERIAEYFREPEFFERKAERAWRRYRGLSWDSQKKVLWLAYREYV
ncbi:MAG: glycosyltransferase [Planctomycetota bacterium]|nr:MAG: glycosyltransferase [Planctomycetota bacterium]